MELADPTANGVRFVWASRQTPCAIWGPGDHSQTACIHDVPLLTECQDCWEKWLEYRRENGTMTDA